MFIASWVRRFSSRLTPIRNGADAKLALHLAVRADHHVLEHGEAREQGQVLKRPRNAEIGDLVSIDIEEVVAVEQDLTRVRFVDPRHDVEQRGLARAVGADQPADLVLVDRERQVVERDDTTEPHGHFSNIE